MIQGSWKSRALFGDDAGFVAPAIRRSGARFGANCRPDCLCLRTYVHHVCTPKGYSSRSCNWLGASGNVDDGVATLGVLVLALLGTLLGRNPVQDAA